MKLLLADTVCRVSYRDPYSLCFINTVIGSSGSKVIRANNVEMKEQQFDKDVLSDEYVKYALTGKTNCKCSVTNLFLIYGLTS